MTKAIVFLVTLMFLPPSHTSAQASASLGDLMRVKQVDGTVLTGELATLSAETIQLAVDSGRVEIPVERIKVLETSRGQQRRFGKYIAMAVVGGAIVGAVYGGINLWPCESLCIPLSRSSIIFAGAITGLPVGVMLGFVFTEERWNPVPIPGPRLTIRPVIGSRVGFAGSIRFGGL